MNRIKAKGRRETGAFLAVPFRVITSDNYRKMSAKAVKLMFDLASQIRVKEGGPVNNGDLCITMSIMRNFGWSSRESLYYARDELIYYGFISETRPGGRNTPTLYALTFFAVNDSHKHYEATRVATNTWKETRKKWKRPRRKLKSLYRKSADVVPLNGTIAVN